jgi:predicted nucleotidyltransferase
LAVLIRPVQSKQDILFQLRRHQALIRQLGVKILGLFGSFLHGQHDPDSDIDLLVEFEPGQKTFDNFMQLSFLLEDSLQRSVELVTPESLSPYLRPHILQEVEDVPFAT